MTEKQLRKMNRADLLNLLVLQSREIDRLRLELEKAKEQLEDRRLLLERTGSIAEASLAVFHVLEDAQKAADLYLENVKAGNRPPEKTPGEITGTDGLRTGDARTGTIRTGKIQKENART